MVEQSTRKGRNVAGGTLTAGSVQETLGPDFPFWEEKENERPQQVEPQRIESVLGSDHDRGWYGQAAEHSKPQFPHL